MPDGRWTLVEPDPERAERYRSAGLWTDDTLGELLDRRLRDQSGLAFRVWSATRPWSGTVGDVHRAAARFAGSLQDRGFVAGDVVAFQLPNCAEAAVVFWGRPCSAWWSCPSCTSTGPARWPTSWARPGRGPSSPPTASATSTLRRARRRGGG